MSIFESFSDHGKEVNGTNQVEDSPEKIGRDIFTDNREFFRSRLFSSNTPSEFIRREKKALRLFLESKKQSVGDEEVLSSKMVELEEIAAKLTEIIQKIIKNDFNSYDDWKEYSLMETKIQSVVNDMKSIYFQRRI